MSIGRTFEESFLKGIRSLEMKVDHLYKGSIAQMDREELEDKMKKCDDERIFVIAQWLRNGYGSETIQKITGMDPFFLYHIQKITRPGKGDDGPSKRYPDPSPAQEERLLGFLYRQKLADERIRPVPDA